MISTIIFDLSEVYLGGMYGLEEKISRISDTKVPPNYLYIQEETQDFFHGKITEDEFWTKLIDRHKWNIDIPTLKDLVRSQMTEIDGTREIIEKLNKNGYKLGLLSIHAREWIDHCEELFDYHKFFHSTLYSFEVGVCKPEPRAFQLILEKLKVTPQEALFIDDYDVNTRAAQSLGISTIVFENAMQLQKDLITMGIQMR